MKIAITHAYCWPEVRRGAERMVPELARALAGRGHQVTILTSGWKAGPPEGPGVRVVLLRRWLRNPPRHEADFSRRLFVRLAAGDYDAVHSFGARDAFASVAAAALHRRRRTVYTNLGLPMREWWRTQPDGRAHDRVARHVDVYGCMSRYALDQLTREYGRSGVLTPGGVNLAEFRPGRRAETPVLMFSGAVGEPRKGVATLLAALPLIAEQEPDVRVWLSGQGDPSPFLAAASPEARERTDVLPLGDPDEQADRCRQAWATVLPSMFDSFGMALLESLASGTPIVASNHAAPWELVSPGTGAACDPTSTRSVADACIEVLRMVRDDVEVAARCRASAQAYDWDTALAPQFEEFYAG